MESKKIWKKTSWFERKLKDLEKEKKYSSLQFEMDVKEFLLDEKKSKFRKHSIRISKTKKVFAIILWYDLRALYFFVRIKEDGIIEYVFFDIWGHDAVY